MDSTVPRGICMKVNAMALFEIWTYGNPIFHGNNCYAELIDELVSTLCGGFNAKKALDCNNNF